MAEPRHCPVCNALIPQGSPRNLCPQCLFRGVLEDDSGNGDAGASVTRGSVLDSIADTIGSVPRVLLRDTGPGEAPGPIVRPRDSEGADGTVRYRIDGEIARGGMGTVLKGRDPDLGRDVALKVLREDHRDNPDLIRRFIEEAQIGGQLQHPGIVPIYELGTFADCRPFFSMKLVKGHTLAELLDGRAGPADDLPRLLSIYQAVCQTVAYAHARGVIHRDLKPSNVMVGSFGEVQVMDWGLAKVLPRGGVVDDARAGTSGRQETVIATARSGSDQPGLSHAGSVMGTPSYMAPEQARGEIDQVDERADVFALGSILCEVLTGAPAFRGRSVGEIQRNAAVGNTADALTGLEACGGEADLVAIAKDCLAREREDRPRSASVVAERVTAYLTSMQERLKVADRDRAVAEARSVEERKQRRLQVGLAASVIALMALGGGGFIWNQGQKAARIAKTARGVDEALAEASRLQGEAQAAPPVDLAKWTLALSAAKRARDLLAQGEADAPLHERVKAFLEQLQTGRAGAEEKAARVMADRDLLARLEAIRGAPRPEGIFALSASRADADYTAAFQKAGLDLDRTDPALVGKWLAARTEPMELASFLDDWSDVRRARGRPAAEWRRLVQAARAADPDHWRDALRARVGDDDPGAVAEFLHLADDEKALDRQPAASLVLLARQLKWLANDRERAARVLRRAVLRHPADFWAQNDLGSVFDVLGQRRTRSASQDDEMLRHKTAAVALRPASPMAHHALARLLDHLGRRDQAIAEFGEVVRLQPDWELAHCDLGKALAAQGRDDLAIAELLTAIRLEPDFVVAHQSLVEIVRKQGRADEAVAEFRKAAANRPDEVNAHRSLAQFLRHLGKRDQAIAAFRDAIRLKPDDARIHVELSELLTQSEKFDDAVAELREAIRVKPDYANGYSHLGFTLARQGKRDEAIAAYREDLRISPGNFIGRSALARLLHKQGKPEEAVAEFREAIRGGPYIREMALVHHNFGVVLQAQGKLDEAVAEYREATRLASFLPSEIALIAVLGRHGKLQQHVAELQEAIRLSPDDAFAHWSLGLAFQRQNKLEQAVAEFREAIRLNPAAYSGAEPITATLKALGKVDDLIAVLREDVEVKRKMYGPYGPGTANALAILGALLVRNGRWTEAEPVLRECLAMREKNDPDEWRTFNTRSQLGGSLLGQGKHAEAEPLIVSGCEGLKARLRQKLVGPQDLTWQPIGDLGPTPDDSESRLAEAVERVVDLYESWGKPDRAAEWRARMALRTFTERVAFAERFYERKQFAASARVWAEALEADPKGAESRQTQHAYNAACEAALAGSGQGEDKPPPNDAERAKFRGQALLWLTAELAAWSRVLDAGAPEMKARVAPTLKHWKVDTDLAGIRDPKSLSKLPEAEQKSWRTLWADVDALLTRASGLTPR
jgi:serine/threonine-protein kinase